MPAKKPPQFPPSLKPMLEMTVRPMCTPQSTAEVTILIDALRVYMTNPKLRAKVIAKQPDTEKVLKAYLSRVAMALALMQTSVARPKRKAKKK